MPISLYDQIINCCDNEYLNICYCIVLNRLREQLTARGSTTIRGLGRSFRLFDSYNGDRKVDSQEFFVGL